MKKNEKCIEETSELEETNGTPTDNRQEGKSPLVGLKFEKVHQASGDETIVKRILDDNLISPDDGSYFAELCRKALAGEKAVFPFEFEVIGSRLETSKGGNSTILTCVDRWGQVWDIPQHALRQLSMKDDDDARCYRVVDAWGDVTVTPVTTGLEGMTFERICDSCPEDWEFIEEGACDCFHEAMGMSGKGFEPTLFPKTIAILSADRRTQPSDRTRRIESSVILKCLDENGTIIEVSLQTLTKLTKRDYASDKQYYRAKNLAARRSKASSSGAENQEQE